MEGLFGRLKEFLRAKGVKKIAYKNHGLLLAEFLWRQSRCHGRSEWRDAPFFPLCELLVGYQQQQLMSKMDPVPRPSQVDDEVAQGFQDWKDANRAIAPPLPPVVAAVVLLPQAPAHAPVEAPMDVAPMPVMSP